MMTKEAVTEIMNAGRASAPLVDVNGTSVFLVPEGYKIEAMDSRRTIPERKTAKVELSNLSSFVNYWRQFSGEHSRIFADPQPSACEIKAVMDYHAAGDGPPAWKVHTATYRCPMSPEWTTWTANSGKAMTQVQFAEFIENNLPDIKTPPGAEMLEVARNLVAKGEVNFASAVRLTDGRVNFTYQEETKGTIGKGGMEVPEAFVLRLPVHAGGPPYEITARLRWRIAEGKLKFWYDLLRPHKVLEAAHADIIAALREAIGSDIFVGKP